MVRTQCKEGMVPAQHCKDGMVRAQQCKDGTPL